MRFRSKPVRTIAQEFSSEGHDCLKYRSLTVRKTREGLDPIRNVVVTYARIPGRFRVDPEAGLLMHWLRPMVRRGAATLVVAVQQNGR